MKKTRWTVSLGLAVVCWAAQAQVPPVAAPDQLALLRSADPHLARNKQFVFDFWRIVFEGGHLDQAPKYMAETYIQHNPNVRSGRASTGTRRKCGSTAGRREPNFFSRTGLPQTAT